MIVLGLTGSIGMGKSRTAGMLRRLGVPVHDSDEAVHRALTEGDAAAAVKTLFPQAVKDGAIDRKTLGGIVFSDGAKLKQLEAVLHPAARASQDDFIRLHQAGGKKAVALDIPLLFETGAEARVDHVICVTAPAATQRRRVLARPAMTAEKFERILAKQMPDEQKRAKSDFVVQTGFGPLYTYISLWLILKRLGVR